MKDDQTIDLFQTSGSSPPLAPKKEQDMATTDETDVQSATTGAPAADGKQSPFEHEPTVKTQPESLTATTMPSEGSPGAAAVAEAPVGDDAELNVFLGQVQAYLAEAFPDIRPTLGRLEAIVNFGDEIGFRRDFASSRGTEEFKRFHARAREILLERSPLEAALDSAFRECRRRGYLAEQDFTCCTSCGFHEMGELIYALPKRKRATLKGGVYYHAQSTDHMAETGTCYLHFAAVTDDSDYDGEAQTKVGRELRDILRAHGLIVDWNEDPGVALLVRPVPN